MQTKDDKYEIKPIASLPDIVEFAKTFLGFEPPEYQKRFIELVEKAPDLRSMIPFRRFETTPAVISCIARSI